MGNPPYSVGQKDDNDDAANVQYTGLDKSIRETYAKHSTGNPRSLYDSYIRAIRWASDRIGSSGVIGFVTNAGFVDGKAADGMRKCLAEEFASIYVFHLRGNARTSGELRRKEKDNVFGMGSRAPIAISLLVKNPDAKMHGQIYFNDIGDYLSREEKLERISELTGIAGMTNASGWKTIIPDEHFDWLKQRDSSFEEFMSIGDKKSKVATTIFSNYTSGVKTNRDNWVYRSSKSSLIDNTSNMVDFYNRCIADNGSAAINDPTKIGWSWVLRGRYERKLSATFSVGNITQAIYRPYDKKWLYYDGFFNENRYQMTKLFPDAASENLVIVIKQRWSGEGQLALMVNHVVDVQSDGGTQCFPLYLHESTDDTDQIDSDGTGDLFVESASKPAVGKSSHTRKDAITDSGLKHFQDSYLGETISKEDLFYYVYGLLHSPDYRERYTDNLSKELPRIPAVKTAKDFWHFSKAGRDLAELHLNYETVQPYPVNIEVAGKTPLTDADCRVEKMKYGKHGKDKDLTTLIYNDRITLTGIPLTAYDYVVNGKPALDWVVERQCVKTDKDSGIVNDANDWAIETMHNAKYPLELFMRVITVSLETMKIVNALPKLDID